MNRANGLIAQGNLIGAARAIVGGLKDNPKNSDLIGTTQQLYSAAEAEASNARNAADAAGAKDRPDYADANVRLQTARYSSRTAGPENAESIVLEFGAAAELYRTAAARVKTVNQVRLLVADGDRVREREGMLQLGDGRVSIVTAAGGAPIMSLPNSSVGGIFYSRSKQPRWRDASGQVVESKIDLGRMGFLRGEQNWIILLTSGEPVIIRIEDSALRTVLTALQERTGQKIQR